MTPQRWQEIKSVIEKSEAALPEERADLLRDLCAGDPDLLREVEAYWDDAQSSGTFVRDVIENSALEFSTQRESFGRYQLVRPIGQGGMGAVYEASRIGDFRKRVALKVIKREFDSDFARVRFQQERQLLAGLEHPYIARLLDGGESDAGSPYLVLEFVDGIPIDLYCKPIERVARLRLFLKVCEAVEYAHRNLIVHRDLKPANILVTENGDPKLLDFGIAKLLDPSSNASHTGSSYALTPEYASPEQVRGRAISTATDIYSLGLILYLLLTGRRPYELKGLTPLELDRVINEQEPAPPHVNEDLDNIILKALRKDAARRYHSARELAEDIERSLSNRPIKARPESAKYLVAKFLRRNRLAVAAGILLAVTLIGGIIASQYQAHIAQRRFAQVRRLANTFVFSVDDSIRNLTGSTAARERIVETGLEYLNSLSADSERDPDLKIELGGAYQKIGDVLGSPSEPSLGKTVQALESYAKGRKLLEDAAALRPKDLRALLSLAEICFKAGSLESIAGSKSKAVENFDAAQRVLDQARSTGSQDPRIEFQDGGLWLLRGDRVSQTDVPQAISYYQRAFEAYSKADRIATSPRYRGATAVARIRIGRMSMIYGETQNAGAALTKSLQVRRELAEADPDNQSMRRSYANALQDYGDVQGLPTYFNLGNPNEALKAYREAQEIFDQTASRDPGNVVALTDGLLTRNRIGAVLAVERPAEALAVLEDAVRMAPRLGNTIQRQDIKRTLALIHQRMAIAGLALHQFNVGLGEMHAAVALYPGLEEELSTYLISGDLQLAAGQRSAAIASWEGAAKGIDWTKIQNAQAAYIRDAALLIERLADAGVDSSAYYRKAITLWNLCLGRGAPVGNSIARLTAKLHSAKAT